ncbi:glycosylated lysosomal membrane protein-like [Dendronephthya gigantea]|uniref:glycosylated lysosomal membrane protein-like n=1 Tax=Dendronephthya gigantea TaxID=151771 RepID=UPI00106910DD|nr:glycosylated lysosomal membrane protein-like [Dendronephthya gigantea]
MASRFSFWMLFGVCSFITLQVFVDGNRKLSTSKLCPSPKSSFNFPLIWVKAMDSSSTIHYLWTTYPVPTIVVGYTTRKDVKVTVDCAALTNETSRNNSIRFSHSMNYTFAFAMPRIYEYDDDDDNVDLTDNSYMVVREFMDSTKWDVHLDASAHQVTFTANDSIILKFVASHSVDRESKLPHEKHTSDSNRFSLTLNDVNVTTNSTRFAVEVNYMVELGYAPDITTKKSIDDEYTPAIFKTVYAKVKGKYGKAYSQWKPIAYTKPELGRMCQTRAEIGSVRKVVNRSWNIGEVAMLSLNSLYQVYGLNVSFGITKDGFYQKTKYLTWSGIVGYGDPATTSISFLVKLIISIGLGLPLAIIVFGGMYVQIRKRCMKAKVNTSYATIN